MWMYRIGPTFSTAARLIRRPIRRWIVCSSGLARRNCTSSTELAGPFSGGDWWLAMICRGTELRIPSGLLYLVRLRSYRREMSLVCK